mmetsp:Transcript_26240/g.36549  ORF Transcript_26240/g.36549 Transcript_26240/m.36549 type:complete len:535 (-) Transcript_26240:83-1687(-)
MPKATMAHEVSGDTKSLLNPTVQAAGPPPIPDYKKRFSFLLRCVSTAALGSLMLGYDQGIISGALVPIEEHFQLTEFEAEMMTSSITFTSIIGSFIAGSFADFFGRKVALLVASVIFFLGSLGMGLAPNYAALITWRCISGIGVGMGLVICPMYCAELAPRSLRGTLTSFNEMFINIGIPLAYLANLLLSGISQDDWRYMLMSGAIPAAGLFVAACALPESPRWLMKNRHPERAETIVRQLIHPSETPETVQRVTKRILSDIDRDMQTAALRDSMRDLSRQNSFFGSMSKEVASWLDVFRRNKKVALIGMSFAIFQQAIGTDAVLLYSVHTLTSFGVSNQTALITTLCMGLSKLVFTMMASSLVDHPSIGRRKPLLIGATGCICGLCIVAISTSFAFSSSSAAGFIIGYVVFMSSFGFSYGPLCWLILAELFKGQSRSKALSLGSVLNRLASFAVTAVYLSCVRWFTLPGTYIGFAVIALFALSFSATCIPELAGRRLGSAAHSARSMSLASRNISNLSKLSTDSPSKGAHQLA